MSKREYNLQDPWGAWPLRFTPWITAGFILSLCSFCIGATVLLFQEEKERVLPIALTVGAVVWGLERLESGFAAGPPPRWNPLSVYIAPAVAIALVSFIACLPTLNTYFLVDDFAFVHTFHNLTASQFLRLFHTDLGQFVWGDTRQEFRPLYSLYYAAGYHLWGLRPWGYHLCSILVHLIVAAMVFLIAKSLAAGETRRAGFAGLLFAVQPPHAQATSLIVGLVAESFPALLYLTAFLCFIHFRSRGLVRYFAISALAFTGCLLTKESAVTLPLMLVFYDLFRIVAGEESLSPNKGQSPWEPWRKLILPYAAFGTLLLAYLEWRRIVFASYLREAGWGRQGQYGVANPTGFWLHFIHLAMRFWKLQAFNFQNLFPYSSAAEGLVLGLYLVWAFSLLRRRSDCRRSVALVLYFGLAWYLISNLPYLIEGNVIYHLYLPTAGVSIAIAFLALPFCREPGKEARCSRLVGMGFLIAISFTQLWKNNREYARIGEMSARMTAQLVPSLKEIPKDSLVMIWPAESYLVDSGWGEEIFPFAVQPPFASTDLYARVRIVEHPDMSCCGVAEWWQKTSPVLVAELARAPDEQVQIYLLIWDERNGVFQETKRVLPRSILRDRVTTLLGGSPETVDNLGDVQAKRLVKGLARLVVAGSYFPGEK